MTMISIRFWRVSLVKRFTLHKILLLLVFNFIYNKTLDKTNSIFEKNTFKFY